MIFKGHNEQITCFKIDSGILFSAGVDKSVICWNPEVRKELALMNVDWRNVGEHSRTS